MSKFSRFLNDNSEWLTYFLFFIIILLVGVIVFSIVTDVKRCNFDGGMVIDKQTMPDRYGVLKFYLIVRMANSSIETFTSLRVDETEYYTYNIGDIFHN